ncbi:MAG: DUF4390 domain-containing protein [Acidiferrobacterales bacterium]|nr:DUF4390 domain-containing protein [Acidiferrobacterales bacterium]
MFASAMVRECRLAKRASLVAVVLMALLIASPAFGFSITFFDATRQDNEVRIKMAADLVLTEEVIKAIQANVDVNLKVQVRIYRVRKYFWDDLVVDTDVIYTISNSNIYRGYEIRSSDGNLDMIYDRLDDALTNLGKERAYMIVVPDDQANQPDIRYRGKCRIYLDRSALPSVVSTTVQFKQSWKLSTEWTEFELP